MNLLTGKLWTLLDAVNEAAPAVTDAALDPAAPAEAEAVAEAASPLAMVIQVVPFLLIGVVLYFMMIRPQRKKDKQVKDMLSNLKVGDRVTTIGGMHGTVTGIRDDNLVVAVGPGKDKNEMVFARWGIRSVDEVSISNDAETLV
ncbi:MAG: preprotein translocase subunit YajC [Oscillospiraceae bacterium]|jgi:preprotein translocase subunit YajC|nr:preprotein translocase subunit YajC [Oscillospiraceae bacterium]